MVNEKLGSSSENCTQIRIELVCYQQWFVLCELYTFYKLVVLIFLIYSNTNYKTLSFSKSKPEMKWKERSNFCLIALSFNLNSKCIFENIIYLFLELEIKCLTLFLKKRLKLYN